MPHKKKRVYVFNLDVEVMDELKRLKDIYGVNMSGVVNSFLKIYIVKKKLRLHNVPLDKLADEVITSAGDELKR